MLHSSHSALHNMTKKCNVSVLKPHSLSKKVTVQHKNQSTYLVLNIHHLLQQQHVEKFVQVSTGRGEFLLSSLLMD